MNTDAKACRRAAEEIAELSGRGLPAAVLYPQVLAILGRVLDVSSACFQTSDPLTGFPVTHGEVGSPPGSLGESLHFEFDREDVSRYSDVQLRQTPLAILSAETGGRPLESPRFREMIEPEGGGDELRVAFADVLGVWGTMVIFSAPGHCFSDEDAALVSRIVAPVSRALRLAHHSEPAAVEAIDWGGPGVIVVDGDERIEMADERALARVRSLGTDVGGSLPAAFSVVCAWARLRDPDRPARARARGLSGGPWLTIDVSPIDDDARGRLAVVIQAATGPDVLDAAMRSHALSAREREVAGLLIAGQANKEIAASLCVSPHTVADHLKSIFEKTGAHTRGGVAAAIFGSATGSP
jgi:DNA-binding CsgD family transcriptional regulator